MVEAVRGGNSESGGRLIEFGGTEYMVRGRGYARSVADFENIVVSASESGTPIRVKDIGQVVLGPDLRRGVPTWTAPARWSPASSSCARARTRST